MKKLLSILESIYGQVSDAVIIYTDQNKIIYQNEQSKHLEIDINEIARQFLEKLQNTSLRKIMSQDLALYNSICKIKMAPLGGFKSSNDHGGSSRDDLQIIELCYSIT